MFYDVIAQIEPVTQCVQFPTRGLNLLDLNFIRNPSKLSTIICHPHIGRSDHNLNCGNYNMHKLISNKFSKKFSKTFAKTEYDGFKRYVVSTLGAIYYTNLSSMQMWDLYIYIYIIVG